MGAVYLAEDTRSPGMQVAIKEMRTEAEATGEAITPDGLQERRQAIDSFEREADILKHLAHPNMPTFTDSFEENGRPYLVMEFVPGDSLEKKLDQLNGRPMSQREALYYGIQIARVLQYLHSQNPPIIFRDVKPANVMIMPNYRVKLIDFGIARKYKAGKLKDTVSMGTAAYAPFEQFGKGQTDARSDIYSLAATLYHLLTGRPPTPATTPMSLRDLNPEVSPNTEQLLIKSMSRDMEQRPRSAREMEQELLRCYGTPFTEPEPVPSPAVHLTPASLPVQIAPTPLQSPAHSPVSPAVPEQPPRLVRPAEAPLVATGSPQPPAEQPHVPAPHTGGRLCPDCRYLNKVGARFCGVCGASLTGRASARLQVMGPRGVLWERRIAPNENPFVIGRRSLSRHIFPHIDLTYSDPSAYVSRRHAQILGDGRVYSLEDLGSENGTYVNDMRIPRNQPKPLHNGDMIQVGKVQMQFVTG